MNPVLPAQAQHLAQPGLPPAPNPAAPGPMVRLANGQQVPAFGVANVPPNQQPQARKIQDEWSQSVAQLHAEICDLRSTMETLLREIKALIQDYNLQTDLQSALGTVTSAVNDLGNVVRSTDHVAQSLRAIDISQWDPTAAQRFTTAMAPLLNRPAFFQQPRAVAPQAPVPIQHGPQQAIVPAVPAVAGAPVVAQGQGNPPVVQADDGSDSDSRTEGDGSDSRTEGDGSDSTIEGSESTSTIVGDDSDSTIG